ASTPPAAHAGAARRATRRASHDRIPLGARRGAGHGADGAASPAARVCAHNREGRTPMNEPTEVAASVAGRGHPPKTVVTVEPGIFKRVDPRTGRVLPKLWIHYPGKDGKTEREPTHTTSIVNARKLRAKRLEQHGRGEAGRAAERILVRELLADYQTDAEVNRRASLPTIVGHVKLLTEALGHHRAVDCTTDRVQAVQREWQRT